MMWEGCMDGVGRLSGECGEAVIRVRGVYLMGVVRLSRVCEDTVWMVWEGCLVGVGMLSGGCGEAVWRVLGDSGGCGEAILRVW